MQDFQTLVSRYVTSLRGPGLDHMARTSVPFVVESLINYQTEVRRMKKESSTLYIAYY